MGEVRIRFNSTDFDIRQNRTTGKDFIVVSLPRGLKVLSKDENGVENENNVGGYILTSNKYFANSDEAEVWIRNDKDIKITKGVRREEGVQYLTLYVDAETLVKAIAQFREVQKNLAKIMISNKYIAGPINRKDGKGSFYRLTLPKNLTVDVQNKDSFVTRDKDLSFYTILFDSKRVDNINPNKGITVFKMNKESLIKSVKYETNPETSKQEITDEVLVKATDLETALNENWRNYQKSHETEAER